MTPTKLIQVDGMFIEVVALEDDKIQQVSSKDVVKIMESAAGKIEQTLVAACKPVVAAWKTLNQDMVIEQAEVELGLSFEGEGNIYITKVTSGANLVVKLVLKPK